MEEALEHWEVLATRLSENDARAFRQRLQEAREELEARDRFEERLR